jgi:hypothetical protein
MNSLMGDLPQENILVALKNMTLLSSFFFLQKMTWARGYYFLFFQIFDSKFLMLQIRLGWVIFSPYVLSSRREDEYGY